ncbi:MAG: 50S ribosomal protein L24e [Candidatus Micrarchaeota archaeon]|nr:50S ribosomal protein L24e [Candidatus Micrarchaeota archaeon]
MECSFCGKVIIPGRGILYFKANGTMFAFCSSKCKINFLKLKRKPRKLKWTRRRE